MKGGESKVFLKIQDCLLVSAAANKSFTVHAALYCMIFKRNLKSTGNLTNKKNNYKSHKIGNFFQKTVCSKYLPVYMYREKNEKNEAYLWW